MGKGLTMTIEQGTRICMVNNRIGYFHCWEHFSKPLDASPLTGGAPAGIFSKVFGIVEFSDCIKRIDPTDIHFCDKDNEILKEFNERKDKE